MALSRYFKVHYLPRVTSAWFVLTFIVTYVMSVQNGHVHPIVPYISDTGALPPESCVFGQMVNIGALLMAAGVYIRYRQVDLAIASDDVDLPRAWNELGFWLGIIISLGISIVGNFQETNLLSVHLLGSVMSFGTSGIYFLIQTRITFAFRHANYKYPEFGVTQNILYIRIVLTCCYFVLSGIVFICSWIAFSQLKVNKLPWWTEEEGGFYFRLAATSAEWALLFVFIAYGLTADREFKSLEFEEIRFKSKYRQNVKENVQEMI